jgi:D-beta-D-heptose 7-phosphate kinase/D-beta-D-heptose 1-phosphate adenosyltransferase
LLEPVILDHFSRLRLLVAGDVMLDRYWWGQSHRLSPEAPVPVVRIERTSLMPGGAANTAANLVALGANAELVGLIGEDREGEELAGLVAGLGIDPAGLVRAPRRTTTKTRVVAHHQHVVRVDSEDEEPAGAAAQAGLRAALAARRGGCHGIVLSDYAKGALTPELLAFVMTAAAERQVPVFVDPKGADWTRYRGCTLLKPNRLELGMLAGRPVRDHAETVAAGCELSRALPGTEILVTEGAEGMTLFLDGAVAEREIPPRQEVFDVTGAGDTVLAALALARCAGASRRQAMRLAALAASLAIRVVGTAAVRHNDLRALVAGETPEPAAGLPALPRP